MLICENGKLVDVEEIENIVNEQEQEYDKLDTLIQGLSSATTVSQIRTVAQDILKETE